MVSANRFLINYNADGNGLAPVGSWVSLSYDTPMVLPPPYIPSSDASSPAVDGPETSDQADLDADLEGDRLLSVGADGGGYTSLVYQ